MLSVFSEDNRLIAVGCLRENFIYLLNKDGILQQKIYFFAMPRHMFFLGSDKVVISSHYDSYLWDLNLRKMFKMTFPFTLMSLQSQTSQGKTTIIFPPNKNQITLYQMEHPKPALTNTTETDVTERPAKRLKL